MNAYTFTTELETPTRLRIKVNPFIDVTISEEDAIEVAIQKWDTLEQALIANPGVLSVRGHGAVTCALCIRVLHNSEGDESISDNCIGCPLALKTGAPQCNYTPYYKFCMNPTAATAREMRELLETLR